MISAQKRSCKHYHSHSPQFIILPDGRKAQVIVLESLDSDWEFSLLETIQSYIHCAAWHASLDIAQVDPGIWHLKGRSAKGIDPTADFLECWEDAIGSSPVLIELHRA